jgi:DNA-binding NarL/FixJ family response regulator
MLDEEEHCYRQGSVDPAAASSAPSVSEGYQQEEAPLLEALTPREAEVLKRIANGLTNQQTARSMLVSVSTVKKHVRSILSKLGVSDRTQAALKARELGLLAEHREE